MQAAGITPASLPRLPPPPLNTITLYPKLGGSPHSPAAKTWGQPLPQCLPFPSSEPAGNSLRVEEGRRAEGARVGSLEPGPGVLEPPAPPRPPCASPSGLKAPPTPATPPVPGSAPPQKNSREPCSLPAAPPPSAGAATSPSSRRRLTCRPGSAPPPGPRRAAPAGSGRPAGRPAVLLGARASRPSLPPSAARPALAPSLLSSAAALYPGSRSPLPAGSRTPRLKGTSSLCLGTPSPPQTPGRVARSPSEEQGRGEGDQRMGPLPPRAPSSPPAAPSPSLGKTSGYCSGIKTRGGGRGGRRPAPPSLHPHDASSSILLPPSPEGSPSAPANPPSRRDYRPASHAEGRGPLALNPCPAPTPQPSLSPSPEPPPCHSRPACHGPAPSLGNSV